MTRQALIAAFIAGAFGLSGVAFYLKTSRDLMSYLRSIDVSKQSPAFQELWKTELAAGRIPQGAGVEMPSALMTRLTIADLLVVYWPLLAVLAVFAVWLTQRITK